MRFSGHYYLAVRLRYKVGGPVKNIDRLCSDNEYLLPRGWVMGCALES